MTNEPLYELVGIAGTVKNTAVIRSDSGELIARVGDRKTLKEWEAIGKQTASQPGVFVCTMVEPEKKNWFIEAQLKAAKDFGAEAKRLIDILKAKADGESLLDYFDVRNRIGKPLSDADVDANVMHVYEKIGAGHDQFQEVRFREMAKFLSDPGSEKNPVAVMRACKEFAQQVHGKDYDTMILNPINHIRKCKAEENIDLLSAYFKLLGKDVNVMDMILLSAAAIDLMNEYEAEIRKQNIKTTEDVNSAPRKENPFGDAEKTDKPRWKVHYKGRWEKSIGERHIIDCVFTNGIDEIRCALTYEKAIKFCESLNAMGDISLNRNTGDRYQLSLLKSEVERLKSVLQKISSLSGLRDPEDIHDNAVKTAKDLMDTAMADFDVQTSPRFNYFEASNKIMADMQNRMKAATIPHHNDIAEVTLPVKVHIQWSDKIPDYEGEDGGVVYKSGFVMTVLDKQEFVYDSNTHKVMVLYNVAPNK